MKKLILFLLAVAASLVLAQAQSGELKGIVKDQTNQPVPFANVVIYGTTGQLLTGAVSDINGEYHIKPITPGSYTVEVSSIGYSRTQVSSVSIEAGKITFLDITLGLPSGDLKTISIQSTRPVIARDQAVQGKTWDRQESLKNPSRDAVGTVRGSRSDALIFIDGVKIRGASGIPQQSAPVILGGVPADAGNAVGGVVSIPSGQSPGIVSNKPAAPSLPGYIGGSNEYTDYKDNDFQSTRREPLSTFSVDVDKASYSLVRKSIREGYVPAPGAVRVEELINYFDYNYPDPTDEHPFRILTELTECPWNKDSRIVKLALQGKRLSETELPPSSFTFLVDVSGSMSSPNKLPLVQASLLKLLDKMRPQDQVGIVVYAGSAGVVLETQPVGKKAQIVSAILNMQAGGSTAGGQGIQKAYELAEKHFIKGGNNRIILCTDGDFNVGISSESDLTALIEKEREKGIYLTVLGYGMGNYKDSKLELLADKGNGNYAYIDDYSEAEKFLGKEFAGSMYAIAKDVKIQIEFNPAHVKSYRLIGYENRVLAAEDFNNDKKDAGEIGSGHTVTALYEIRTDEPTATNVDSLKYQRPSRPTGADLQELATVKFRYKNPGGDKSVLITQPVNNDTHRFVQAEESTRFAIAVAAFGQLLRKSPYVKGLSITDVLDMATAAIGDDKQDLRKEFIQMVKEYKKLDGLAKN